jgi:peptide/nickel transport system substrate-binding protein
MIRVPIALLVLLSVLAPAPAGAGPEGQMTLVLNVSTAARWFDPSEAEAVITPFIFYNMIHDALVKPLPGNPMAASLAESWSASADGLVYEFVLRKGVRFHNGDPVTAEDVKFSFDRYKGASAKLLKERVAGVEVVDTHRVRFRLSRPWLDFLTFYGTPATGAAWIVPKKYVEKVGDDGFKRARAGRGSQRAVLAQDAKREDADRAVGSRRLNAPGHA